MPHGISDSEWARVGAKSIGEYNEKMKEEQIARDSIAEVEVPVLRTDIPEIPEEIPVEVPAVEEAKVEEVKPVAKKRGRPAKASKMIRAKEIVILETKKAKKSKRGKR